MSATTGIYLVGIIGFTKTAHLLSCAILGGFTLSIALDHYMGASIKFILLNFLRRTFVPGYSSVCCQLPFQVNYLCFLFVLKLREVKLENPG